MEIKYEKVTVNIPDSWDEIKLGKYLEFDKVASSINDENPWDAQLKTYKLIEIICDITEEEMDDITVIETNDLANRFNELVKQRTGISIEPKRSFVINDTTYMSIDPKKMSNSEYITANMLLEQYGQNSIELIPKLLAILIRPTEQIYNNEKKMWDEYPKKFDKRDYEDLEWRSKLFWEKANAMDVLPIADFFLNTNNG